MKLESILEISSVEAINCSACSSEIKFKSLDKCSMERTSAQEPFEIYRNCLNSLFDCLSNPSAILFIIETAARSICPLKP